MNKLQLQRIIAKLASDHQKPDGLTVVAPEQAAHFLDAIPIHKFFGVGKVTEATLRHLGILTGADLKQLSEERLRILFGERGSLLYRYVRGEDDRPVEPMRVRKSVGKEVTLAQDIDDPDQMLQILEHLAEQVERRLTELGLQGKTITLKLRWSDFRLMTRSLTVAGGVRDAHTMMPHLRWLLARLDLDQQPVRLLGVALSNLIPTQETEVHQTVTWTSLWDMESEALPPLQREGQREDEMEFMPPTGAS